LEMSPTLRPSRVPSCVQNGAIVTALESHFDKNEATGLETVPRQFGYPMKMTSYDPAAHSPSHRLSHSPRVLERTKSKVRYPVNEVTMNNHHGVRKPVTLRALISLEAVFAVVGFASGVPLVYDPSGKAMGLSTDLLERTPVSDFLLVGLFFIAFYGVLPLAASYGLMSGRRWRWTDILDRRTGQHWGWTASVAVGVILEIWIAFELLTMGFLNGSGGVLQVAMAGIGIVMLALASRPSVRGITRIGA
jgi:hypothetical protein